MWITPSNSKKVTPWKIWFRFFLNHGSCRFTGKMKPPDDRMIKICTDGRITYPCNHVSTHVYHHVHSCKNHIWWHAELNTLFLRFLNYHPQPFNPSMIELTISVLEKKHLQSCASTSGVYIQL